jgi:hypothetical protein
MYRTSLPRVYTVHWVYIPSHIYLRNVQFAGVTYYVHTTSTQYLQYTGDTYIPHLLRYTQSPLGLHTYIHQVLYIIQWDHIHRVLRLPR